MQGSWHELAKKEKEKEKEKEKGLFEQLQKLQDTGASGGQQASKKILIRLHRLHSQLANSFQQNIVIRYVT